MKPLVTNKRVLQWLCVYPLDENSNKKWVKWACVAFALYVFTSNLFGISTSAVFIWKFMVIDLKSSLYALIQVTAFSSGTYMIVIAFIMRHQITGTIKQLSEIYDEYKEENSFRYLAQANNKGEWMWQIYLKYVMGGFFVTTPLIAAVTVLTCFIMNGSFDASDVYHPYKIILPVNQTTSVGYVVEIAYVLNPSEAFLITSGALLLLFISICLHHQAFYKMFRHSVRKLNRMDKNQNDAELLCHLIRFHITAKDWFLESAKVYSPLIVVQLICGIIISACSVFQLDLALKHIDITIFILLIAITSGLATLFLYCFFGNSATHSFGGMADCLYDANWHELPVKLQKYFIIMIANTQKPLHYRGIFGITVLNLDTFLKVLRAVYTYYMIFKTLTSD